MPTKIYKPELIVKLLWQVERKRPVVKSVGCGDRWRKHLAPAGTRRRRNFEPVAEASGPCHARNDDVFADKINRPMDSKRP
jgi:hypothetical protein